MAKLPEGSSMQSTRTGSLIFRQPKRNLRRALPPRVDDALREAGEFPFSRVAAVLMLPRHGAQAVEIGGIFREFFRRPIEAFSAGGEEGGIEQR